MFSKHKHYEKLTPYDVRSNVELLATSTSLKGEDSYCNKENITRKKIGIEPLVSSKNVKKIYNEWNYQKLF